MVGSQFVKFLVTGGIAAAANIGSRYILNLFMNFELAVFVAYLVGMTVRCPQCATIAYVLARLFVFESSGRCVSAEFGRFAIVNLFALAFVWIISVGLALVVFPAIHFTWHAEDVAHFIGVLAPAVTSFLGHRHFSFGKEAAGG